MILSDYLRTILNLNRNPVPSDWKLDPREDFGQVFDSQGTPRGIGNQVSVEFNMIYRWHSAVSSQDEAWANGFFKKVFGPNANPGKAFTTPQRILVITLTTYVLKLQCPPTSSCKGSANGPPVCQGIQRSGPLVVLHGNKMGHFQMLS